MNNMKRTLGFIALMIATFLGTLDSTIVNIALPNMTIFFKVSISDTGWISTIYVLSLSVFMITAAKLADQFGRKKLLMIGLVIFGVSSALCVLSKSLSFLIAVRFIQGIGASIITPVGLPMGLEILGKEKRQLVVGTAGAVISLAAASGPPLGGLLVQCFNWQSIFFVNIPITFIAVVLTFFFVQESYDTSISRKIDCLGVSLITSSLFCLTFALLKGSDFHWNSLFIIFIFICSAVTMALFIFVEFKSEHPMLELKLFKELTFTASCICYMMVGFGITSTMLIFNYFLENFLGYPPLKAALLIIAISLTSSISVPLGSILAKKIGTRPINFLGVFFMGAGVFMLSKIDISTTKIYMLTSLVIFGLGLGFAGQAIAASIKYLPEEKSGIASGIINAFRQVGTCIGVAILVSMLASNINISIINIKSAAISNVSKQDNIDPPIKTAFIEKLNKISSKTKLSKTEMQLLLERESKIYVATLPTDSKSKALKYLVTEENTLTHLIDKNIALAFDKTFLFSSIMLMLASIFGFFTDKTNNSFKH